MATKSRKSEGLSSMQEISSLEEIAPKDMIDWAMAIWIAGFFDGEGCVGGNVIRNGYGYTIHFNVTISQTEEKVLKDISNFLKDYEIKNSVRMQYRPNPHHKDCYVLYIRNPISVFKFLKMIYPHLHTSKSIQAHIMLEKILPRYMQKVHTTEDGMIEIMGFIDEMNSYKGGVRGKYNQMYFIERRWNRMWREKNNIPNYLDTYNRTS